LFPDAVTWRPSYGAAVYGGIAVTTVILSRFFARCPDLGGLVGDTVFDESA
jgi:hypothetical protein